MKELQSGLLHREHYKELLTSDAFREMEKFSDEFLKRNGKVLSAYPWVKDSFHQWSRQWEYPFVYSKIIGSTVKEGGSYSVLDLGSGATFFPYFLNEKVSNADITCVDSDVSLKQYFDSFNAVENKKVEFIAADMRKLPLPEHSYDLAYCVSVLEHTKDYEEIIREIKRVLRPNGKLILTFDISIDGDADIPLPGAEKLLAALKRHFTVAENETGIIESVSGAHVYTTKDFKNTNLLPWKKTFRYSLYLAKQIMMLKRPRSAFRNLTVWCGVFINK